MLQVEFLDNPKQPADAGLDMLEPELRIDRVEVKLKLQFVKVKRKSQKSGGEVLKTIDWGFWYTKESNGIFE